MKRAFVLAAVLGTAAALNGAADAARWNGVIVAKDAKRKAVVTVTRGSVRTVRAPSKFRRLRVGQRVAVNARTLPDGTYAAATIRGQGRVSQVRFRGIVVRHDRCTAPDPLCRRQCLRRPHDGPLDVLRRARPG